MKLVRVANKENRGLIVSFFGRIISGVNTCYTNRVYEARMQFIVYKGVKGPRDHFELPFQKPMMA